MVKGIIYKYTNKINGQSYIGQTTNEQKRKNAHESCVGDTPFHSAIIYYGLMNFDYEVLERDIPKDILNDREVYWIEYYDTFNNGYNSTKGGSPHYNKSLDYKLDKNSKTEAGIYLGGNIMYGYNVKNKKYVVNKKEAEIIRYIYNLYIDTDLSIRELAKRLNDDKIFKDISYNTIKIEVSNILHRKEYTGEIKGKPKIISKSLFDKVQYKLNHRQNCKIRKECHILHNYIYNNKGKRFVSHSNGLTDKKIAFSLKTCNVLLDYLKDIEYDKIIASRINRITGNFLIYNNNIIIKEVNIDTYHNKIL